MPLFQHRPQRKKRNYSTIGPFATRSIFYAARRSDRSANATVGLITPVSVWTGMALGREAAAGFFTSSSLVQLSSNLQLERRDDTNVTVHRDCNKDTLSSSRPQKSPSSWIQTRFLLPNSGTRRGAQVRVAVHAYQNQMPPRLQDEQWSCESVQEHHHKTRKFVVVVRRPSSPQTSPGHERQGSRVALPECAKTPYSNSLLLLPRGESSNPPTSLPLLHHHRITATPLFQTPGSREARALCVVRSRALHNFEFFVLLSLLMLLAVGRIPKAVT